MNRSDDRIPEPFLAGKSPAIDSVTSVLTRKFQDHRLVSKNQSEGVKTVSNKTKQMGFSFAVSFGVLIIGCGVTQLLWGLSSEGGPAAAPSDPHYQFVSIDGSPTSTDTLAFGINDSRLVSGFYSDASSEGHGFLWRGGTLQTVDYPEAAITELGPSNNLGVTILNYGDVNTQHAATYDTHRAIWTTFPDIPGQPVNFADGINDWGIADGSACQGNLNASSDCEAWTWNGKKYSLFTVPQAAPGTAFPTGSNDPGKVVGFYQDSSGVYHGFLKIGDSYTTVDVPFAGATGSVLYGINNLDEMVGAYFDASGLPHGVVVCHGVFTSVDVPFAGVLGTNILGVNDRGDISGEWFDSTLGHAFVAFKP